MHGPESFLLRRRVRTAGFEWHSFPYRSTLRSLDEAAHDLHRFAAAIPGDELHWIAHSLGGLIVHRCFALHPRQRSGRVVFLGVPAQASRSAGHMVRWRVGRMALGHAAQALLSGSRRWEWSQALGVIAGTRPVGLGRLMGALPSPHDGTVSVAETQVPGATDKCELAVSHSGLLFSPLVSSAVLRFLRHGRFS